MAVALGLGAALFWGLADYFAAVASRQVGALRVVLGFHLVAVAALAVVVLATGALSDVSGQQVLVFAGIGVVGWASYLTFYGALAIGPISVLSPIISGYAAVTALLAVAVLGERLSAFQASMIVVTIAGAMVAGADVSQLTGTRLERRSLLGFGLALSAMALLGGFIFGVSYYRPRIGWLGPIFLARGFTAAFLFVNVLFAKHAPPGRWSGKVLAIVIALAFLDTGGYVFFNLGVGHRATALVAAASAAYGVVPVVMGVSLFHERPTGMQWLGVGLVFTGVVALGAAA
jgi:drug/metabolite transporter (DMT)-like permease